MQVLVVGGGAAGILAAYRAAALGSHVTLLEKNDRLGMKILISGGGKCNVTHDGEMESIRRAFRPPEARFLKPSFYRFSNRDIVDLLERKRVPLYTRPDGRIFPRNGTARDVVAALRSCLEDVGVKVCLNSPASGLLVEPARRNDGAGVRFPEPEVIKKPPPAARVAGVYVGPEVVIAEHVVLCVGGSSYPGTGTTGDGWKWAAEVGHTIVPLRAALAPLFLESPHVDWAGVALRDCALKARQSNKVFVSWRGDLLFTHRGVSGPCALGISREVAERRPFGPVGLEIDLNPGRSPENVARDLQQWVQQGPRLRVASFLEPLLPERLTKSFLADAGCSDDLRAAHLTQKIRNRLAQQISGWQIGSVQHIPLEKGEVVAGGVSLDEVDPQTMRSSKVEGLYLCGEVLDLAGPVGGYNLQAAWSTGWVAGESAARDS